MQILFMFLVELLPEDEIMVSAAKFGGPHFLFAYVLNSFLDIN